MKASTVIGLVVLAGAGAAAVYFTTRKKRRIVQPQQSASSPWTFKMELPGDRNYRTSSSSEPPQKSSPAKNQIPEKEVPKSVAMLDTDWIGNAFRDFSAPKTPASPPVNNYVMADRRNPPRAEPNQTGFLDSIIKSLQPAQPISLLRPPQKSPVEIPIESKAPGFLDYIFGSGSNARPSQSNIPTSVVSERRPIYAPIQTQRPAIDAPSYDSPLSIIQEIAAAVTEPIRKIVEPIETPSVIPMGASGVRGRIQPWEVDEIQKAHGWTPTMVETLSDGSRKVMSPDGRFATFSPEQLYSSKKEYISRRVPGVSTKCFADANCYLFLNNGQDGPYKISDNPEELFSRATQAMFLKSVKAGARGF